MHYRELVTYLTFLSSIHLPSLLSEVPVREALWAVHLTLVPSTSGLWGKSLQADNRDELVMFHASLQVVFRGPVPPIGNATYRGSRVQAFGYKGQAPKSVLVVVLRSLCLSFAYWCVHQKPVPSGTIYLMAVIPARNTMCSEEWWVNTTSP